MDDANDSNSTLPAKFGRYHVMASIPGGAMGRLYLAQDPEIDRTVVIKALAPDCSQEQKTRFLREARAAGRLSHPNVVSIFDVGEQDRTPFIVMEYIEGDTLSTIIRNREPILFSRRLELIDQLCAGLAYAHDQGVVHRDIKPSNLMLDKSGKLRILDFGIARLDTTDATQTSTGIVGTLNYMSPEQWEGGVIEGRSDMFSVGAVMYELFSFTKAFPGNTPPEVLRYMFGEGPRPLQEVCPLAPPALAEVVARMLARTPDLRYANLHEVREALAALRADVHDMPVDLGDQTATMPAGPPGSRTATPARGTMRPLGPITDGGTRPTSATGWPRGGSGSTVTQVALPVNLGAAPPPPAPAQAPARNRTMMFVAIGAAGVIVAGLVTWIALGGLRGRTTGDNTPPASAPAANSVVAPAPAPVIPTETPAPPPGGRAAGDTTTQTTAPAKSGTGTKTPANNARGAARGTTTTPAPPPAPVDLTITWTEKFEVFQNGKNLTNGAREKQDLKGVRPELGDVYAENTPFRLRYRIPTEKSGSIPIPSLGRLAVTLIPQYQACTVVINDIDFRKGPIFPTRPAPIASGRLTVSLKCPNGLKAEPQIADVKPGMDATELHFPRSGGG